VKYRDRFHAGQVLAKRLNNYRDKNCIVLALPNGGIPVGIEIARELHAEFDLLFVSKITPKFNTEIGYGSISESGVINLNRKLIERLGLSVQEVNNDIEKTERKIATRMRQYKKKGYDIKGKIAILVDDGIASGYTMLNAIDTVKKKHADEIIIAVPTAPLEKYDMLAPLADQIICPLVRDTEFFAVADAYENWYDISFEGAIKLLKRAGYFKTNHHSH
jgi:putative phosphoribosyl transferase